MNELDLIRGFRAADAASASADVRSAARQRLSAHISPPDPPQRRWLLPAGGLAIAAAAAVTIALTSGVQERELAPGDAAAALNQAAEAAEQRGLPVLRSGDYFYRRSRHAYRSISADGPEGTWTIMVPGESESWSARDASGRLVARPYGRPTFPTARDRARWIAAGRPPQSTRRTDTRVAGEPKPWYLNDEAMSYRELLALPTDPTALRAHLRKAAGDSGFSPDAETVTLITDMLRDNPVPSRLRAALFRAMALVPGVRFQGEMEDRLGRGGVGVSYDDEDGIRQLLIFDPDTSAVLEERMTSARSGKLVGYRVVVESGVVHSTRERP